MLFTTSATNSPGRTPTNTSLEQLLPAGGRELSAVVRQVSNNESGAGTFRIQVEANNRLLELLTRAPLNSGDKITLSRSPAGELQLLLSTPTSARADSTATATATVRTLLMQIPAAQAEQLQQLQQQLPLNTPRTARVISSMAATTQATAPPAPSTSSQTQSPSSNAPSSNTSSSPRIPAGPTGNAAGAVSVSTSPPTNSAPTPQVQPSPLPASAQRATDTAPADNRPVTTPSRPSDSRQAPAADPVATRPSIPSSQPSTSATARVQVYSAQLQQINQLSASTAAAQPTPAPDNSATSDARARSTITPATVPAPETKATTAPTATANMAETNTRTDARPSATPMATASPTPVARTPQPATSATQLPAERPSIQAHAQTQASPVRNDTPSSPPRSLDGATRFSHTGNTLLQALGQQQARPPIQHLVQLQLANQQIELASPRPLQTGQQVLLTRTSQQQVQLQPILPNTLDEHTPAQKSAMQDALREALPRQIPFGDALNQLVQLSQSPAGRSQGAIGQLVQSMLSLFSVTPDSSDADQAVKRNLQQGGLLTESRLAQAGGNDKPAPDLKQQLGQLMKAAEQLPPEARQQMQRLVDALQARSTSQQVSSLQAWKELPDGGQERVFRLDLPIRQAERHDTAELTISEHRQPRKDSDEVTTFWSVALHFDLPDQGSVDARLSLHEEWRLQLQFWAESPATVQQIERQLDTFSTTLHDKGFLVDRLQARQGRPSQPQMTDIQRRLVDVHT